MPNYKLALLLLLIWGCANRVQPTGGPKDEEPPIAVFSTPLPGELNYEGQEIMIEFSEFISANGLKDQLIITPRIDGDYEFDVKKKTLFIQFEEPFKDSTTYTLNFREGIGDITEKNPAENLILPFSTGNILDTLEINGNIVDLMTKDPIEGATVALYTVDDTLDIFTGSPYYSTKSDAKGEYTFRNLRDDSYRLYAFVDVNKNLTCQSKKEPYAFLSQPLKVDTTLIADTLNMQFLNIDTLEVIRTRQAGQYFILQANKYLVQAELRSENDSLVRYKFENARKNIKIYNSFLIKDSVKIYATLEDSLGYIIDESFYMSFTPSSRKGDEFKVSISAPVGSKTKKIVSGEIRFDKPLLTMNLDSISIRRDSIEQYYFQQSNFYQFDSLKNMINFGIEIPGQILDSLDQQRTQNAKTKRDGRGSSSTREPYSVYIPHGAFISIEGDSSAATSNDIKFVEVVQTGLILGNVSTSYQAFSIQLLDENFNLVQEQQNGNSYSFREISPGKYHLRILIDENENGRWDPGHIWLNQLPEKVIIYHDKNGNKKTSIRANWELTIDLSF